MPNFYVFLQFDAVTYFTRVMPFFRTVYFALLLLDKKVVFLNVEKQVSQIGVLNFTVLTYELPIKKLFALFNQVLLVFLCYFTKFRLCVLVYYPSKEKHLKPYQDFF